MGMKREKQHILFRSSNQGFTMVELLVAMVVSLLALAAIYSTFLAQHRSYQVQEETAGMQQNIRAAMYYMQRETRMAGTDPFNTGNFGITAASQNSITFTEDITGPPAGIPIPVARPDGAANNPNENITYALNGTNLVRTDNTVVPAVPQVVAQNIDWLDFVYLDNASPPNIIPFVAGAVPAANLSQIRSIEITIVARTNDPLLYGSKNNNTYWNQQGTASWTSAVPGGDNVSRRRLTTLINCRNIGL